jgi:hypothetical protein
MVRQLVERCSPVVHDNRLAAVVKVVEGIIRADRLMPATIGRNLPGRADPKHGIKCVDRLRGNAHMVSDRRAIFQALSERLLHGGSRPVILVDWPQSVGTNEARGCCSDRGSSATHLLGGSSAQEAGQCHGRAGFSDRFEDGAAVGVPGHRRVDAGLKGPFFQTVRELGWDFLGRVRATAKAIASDGTTIAKEEFYDAKSHRFGWPLGDVRFRPIKE